MSEQDRRESTLLSVTFAGRSFVVDGRAGADLIARQMQNGSYEAPLPMLLMAVLTRAPGLFLDVGANNGIYSILAAFARPEVQVWAFEPYPPVAEALSVNLSANDIAHRVQVQPLALSDSDGEVELFIPDPAHGLLETSASLEADFKPCAKMISVKRMRLDSITLPQKAAVIKVDIEGHEAAFFRGARHTLERDRPIVFAEMLIGAQKHFYTLSKMLTGMDYLLFRLRDSCVISTKTIQYDDKAWNYGFVPKEKSSLFISCCHAHRLDMFSFFEETQFLS